jgi:hypothetical protein
MHTYRVWFTDGTAILIDAKDKAEAKAIVKKRLARLELSGKVRKYEQLN